MYNIPFSLTACLCWTRHEATVLHFRRFKSRAIASSFRMRSTKWITIYFWVLRARSVFKVISVLGLCVIVPPISRLRYFNSQTFSTVLVIFKALLCWCLIFHAGQKHKICCCHGDVSLFPTSRVLILEPKQFCWESDRLLWENLWKYCQHHALSMEKGFNLTLCLNVDVFRHREHPYYQTTCSGLQKTLCVCVRWGGSFLISFLSYRRSKWSNISF